MSFINDKIAQEPKAEKNVVMWFEARSQSKL